MTGNVSVPLPMPRAATAIIAADRHKAQRMWEPSAEKRRQQAKQHFEAFDYVVVLLMRAWLAANGIELTHRGRWRKVRYSRLPVSWTMHDSLVWPEGGRLLYLMDDLNEGDPDALPELRRVLADWGTWELATDLAGDTEEAYLRLIAAGELQRRQTLTEQREKIEATHSRDGTTALELVLIRRIGLAWLQAQHAELMAGRIPLNDYKERKRAANWRERAHRHLRVAKKDLAKVRGLLPPTNKA